MQPTPPPKPLGDTRTALSPDGWAVAMRLKKITNDKALAAALQISEPALWRVRKGISQPGAKFIRHAIEALGVNYEQLFVHESDTESAA